MSATAPSLPPEAPERRAIEAVCRHAAEGRLPTIARSLGLHGDECAELLQRVGLTFATDPPREDSESPPFLDELIALLWAHRASETDWTRLMAGTIASACFGARHLWQDIGLAGRDEVSGLLARYFPALAAGNTRALKWKRYFFLRLGDQLALDDLRPPRCDGCEDFELCYGAPRESERIVVHNRDGARR